MDCGDLCPQARDVNMVDSGFEKRLLKAGNWSEANDSGFSLVGLKQGASIAC